jgi:hypothetical protein
MILAHSSPPPPPHLSYLFAHSPPTTILNSDPPSSSETDHGHPLLVLYPLEEAFVDLRVWEKKRKGRGIPQKFAHCCCTDARILLPIASSTSYPHLSTRTSQIPQSISSQTQSISPLPNQ